jgi:class 3 adenylate cyclase
MTSWLPTPARRPSLNWLRALAEIGANPADSDELRLRKAVLVLSSTLIACLAVVWVGTFAALGLWVSAAIPFAYQAMSALGIYAFARTQRYPLFRRSQLWLWLVLPFALQSSLGGFRNGSEVCLWAFTSPLGALLFVGTREALPWMAAFAALVVLSGAIDPALAATAPHIPDATVVTLFVLNIVGVTGTGYVLLQQFVRAREREHARSERLLLKVLPAPIAARLRRTDGIIADACAEVTVLFADIVDFTALTERLGAEEVVAVLDRVFALWDRLAARNTGSRRSRRWGTPTWPAPASPPPRGPRRGDRGDGPGDAARPGTCRRRDRPAARGSHRHRHRAGRRRRYRPVEIHLRPLGRHRQHRKPHGIPRCPGNHPGNVEHIRPSPQPLRATTTWEHRGRRQRHRGRLHPGATTHPGNRRARAHRRDNATRARQDRVTAVPRS